MEKQLSKHFDEQKLMWQKKGTMKINVGGDDGEEIRKSLS